MSSFYHCRSPAIENVHAQVVLEIARSHFRPIRVFLACPLPRYKIHISLIQTDPDCNCFLLWTPVRLSIFSYLFGHKLNRYASPENLTWPYHFLTQHNQVFNRVPRVRRYPQPADFYIYAAFLTGGVPLLFSKRL